MSENKGEKPPTQILSQSETLQITPTFYSPSLAWKIAEFLLDNCIPHLFFLIVAFILGFIVPLYVDTALGYTSSFVGFLLSFALGATLDIYEKSKIEIWRHWFRLKKW